MAFYQAFKMSIIPVNHRIPYITRILFCILVRNYLTRVSSYMEAVLRVLLAGQYLVNIDEDELSLHIRIFTASETILLILLSHGHRFKLGHSKWLPG